MTISKNRAALARAIHSAGARCVLAVTGGAGTAISDLLATSGASRSVLAAFVPYAPQALAEWLGAAPEHACSTETAASMAMAAFMRARRYHPTAADRGSLVGVGCTASLASDRPKRGPHRVHVAWQTAARTSVHSIVLIKQRRNRAEEERLAADLVLNAVAEACGVAERVRLRAGEDEPIEAFEARAPAGWTELLLGAREADRLGPPPGAGRRAIFPGAFHPLHDGHRRMAALAAERLSAAVEFEISIENVDKPPLDFLAIERRAAQFDGEATLWLTRAPTFAAKARLFPGATFVVGVDTMRRIADLHYYDGDDAAREAAIEEITARKCRFLVFGRATEEGFLTLKDLELPAPLQAICDGVASSEFREDVSSTELRRQKR